MRGPARAVVDKYVRDDFQPHRKPGMRSGATRLEEISEPFAASGPDALECGAALLGERPRCAIGFASGRQG